MSDKIAPGELMNEVNALTRERDELRAENERLKAALQEVGAISSMSPATRSPCGDRDERS